MQVPPGDGDAAVLAGLLPVWAGIHPASTEAEAIDRIRVLEGLKSACAAAQARETAALRELRWAEDAPRGVPVRERGRQPTDRMVAGASPGSRHLPGFFRVGISARRLERTLTAA
jgi:hypothetical protein